MSAGAGRAHRGPQRGRIDPPSALAHRDGSRAGRPRPPAHPRVSPAGPPRLHGHPPGSRADQLRPARCQPAEPPSAGIQRRPGRTDRHRPNRAAQTLVPACCSSLQCAAPPIAMEHPCPWPITNPAGSAPTPCSATPRADRDESQARPCAPLPAEPRGRSRPPALIHVGPVNDAMGQDPVHGCAVSRSAPGCAPSPPCSTAS